MPASARNMYAQSSPAFTFLGLCVYFGYGIWHSKEGLRELQPKDMAARYVVLPSGSLVQTVQSVQPDGQVDASAQHANTSTTPTTTASEQPGRTWSVDHRPSQWANVIYPFSVPLHLLLPLWAHYCFLSCACPWISVLPLFSLCLLCISTTHKWGGGVLIHTVPIKHI